MLKMRLLKKSYSVFKNYGFSGVKEKVVKKYRKQFPNAIFKNNSYKKWIKENERELSKIDLGSLASQYLISIVMPTYNTNPKYLRETIESVVNQTYTKWELSIVDDASTNPKTIKVLNDYEKEYDNIKVIYRQENGNISRATNDAMQLVSGEYIAFLDHDDKLSINAIYEVVKLINQYREAKIIYSDEDKIDRRGNRYDPHFKSDWNPDMFFSQNYLSHLTVIEKKTIDKTKGLRVGYEGSQDYDLLLQCLKFIDDKDIYHIPKILYHWRAIKGSTAFNSEEKDYTTQSAIKALEEYFIDRDVGVVARGILPNTYKVEYKIKGNPKVSIIIPTKDNYILLYGCIFSILEKTSYINYEIIIMDNQTTQQKAVEYLQKLSQNYSNIKVIKYDKPFNFSSINNAALSYVTGDYLAFLNNDVEVINPLWLDEMLQHAQREEIGIVGAKLYYEDMSIQHAGVVLGIGGVAGHAHKKFKKNAHGYFSRLKIIQNYSAVTAACIVIKKSIFLEVDGFDEELEIAFNDIDLSLKVLNKGYRNLWTPYAELFHHESKSRGKEDTPEKVKRFGREIVFMKKRWGAKLLEDKCYNPNLTLKYENFSLRVN